MEIASLETPLEEITPQKSYKGPSPTIGVASVMATQRKMAKITIIVPTIGALLAVLYGFYFGITVVEISLLVGMYILCNLGIEFCFHRDLAHRSYKTHSYITYMFGVLGSMAAQGNLLYWVATHRRHHIHSDTEHDPHSPHMRNISKQAENMGTLQGLWHAHVSWMVNDKMTNCTLFAKDINRDPGLSWITRNYIPIVVAGLILPGIVGGLVMGSLQGFIGGVLWGGFLRMSLGHHSTWFNSSFAHKYGARPFETGDKSCNNMWVAIPTFGAGLQNNHHAFPTSAYLGYKWWEIDIAGYFIRLMKRIGLVWEVRFPSEDQKRRKLVGAGEAAAA